jgi:hypothetical protein
MEVILEFLIFGIVIGVVEDLIAIKVTTEETITWSVIGIIVLIAIPFAFIGEVVADQIDFAAILEKLFSKKEKKKRI